METIEEVVSRRKISVLAHFTRLENVGSILQCGLLPRDALSDLPALVNDAGRFDGHESANCLSVSFPNYRMFYKLRCNSPGSEWAVLLISPEVLSNYDCAYFVENAASARFRRIPVSRLSGSSAFEALFAEIDGRPSRVDMRLPDAFPTNPQAEVLVFAAIPRRHIRQVLVESSLRLSILRAEHPDVDFDFDPYYFGPRQDHKHWTTTEEEAKEEVGEEVQEWEVLERTPPPRTPRPDEVRVGSTLVLEGGREITIGTTLSAECPVALALIGHIAGETVTVTLSTGRVVTMAIREVTSA